MNPLLGSPDVLSSADVLKEYTISTWRREHGLPDNRVKAVLQTRDGYLWIGTQRGLARFDGQRFTVFDRLNTPAMTNANCWKLAEDVEGNLWIGTAGGLIQRMGTRFTRAPLPAGHPNYGVYALCASRGGGIWAGVSDHLCLVRDANIKVYSRVELSRLPSVVSAVEEEEGGVLLLASEAGLTRFDPELGRFNGTAAPDGFERLPARAFCRAVGGERWVFYSKGLLPATTLPYSGWLACFKDGRWVRTPKLVEADFQFDHRFDFLVADHLGAVWLPAISNGVHRFALGQFQFLPMPHEGKMDYPLCAYEDRDGNLWIGTEASGLQRWTPRKVVNCTTGEGLAHDNAWTICEARDGGVWIGTDGGVSQLKDGRLVSFTQTNGLARNEVRAVVEDRDGTIWVGTLNGLDSIRDGQVSHVRFTGEWFETKIRALLPARDGALWIGTVRGLTRLHNGQPTKYSVADGLGAQEVRAMLEDRAGTLWVGTLGGGLTRFGVPPSSVSAVGGAGDSPAPLGDPPSGTGEDMANIPSGQSQRGRSLIPSGGSPDRTGGSPVLPGTNRAPLSVTSAAGIAEHGTNATSRLTLLQTVSTTNGLSNDNVWALHEDADGVLWIGTEQGVNRLHDGRVTVFTMREGLPNDVVNTLLEDDFDRLWVGHDRGIYRVAKQELNEVAAGRANSVRAVSYDQTDGLLTTEVNGQKSFPAACKTRDGRLWFPTVKGVAVIDPAKVALDATPPLTVIEEIRAGGETVFANSRATTNAATPPSDFALRTSTLRLLPGHGRVLEFLYTANTFVAPERVLFRYRMIGLEPNWIDVGTRREVFFTDLRPGDYEFEIIAANHHGVWPERGARMTIHLAPFLYQTWWFYALCGTAAAALVGGIVTWRLRELRRIHRLQEQAAIVAERARLAKDLHDGLGADLSRLTLLADLASDDSESGTAEHIRKLSRTSRQAARDLKELIWLANPTNDTVDGLVSRLCQTAEDLLRDARIRCRLDVAPSLPQHPLSLEQRRNLLLVVRESLNNIIKHAAATEVCLRAHARDGGLQLAIEDNGQGFDPTTVQPGTLGLVSMRQRIENLGGSFTLESRPGAGTKITIEVNQALPQ